MSVSQTTSSRPHTDLKTERLLFQRHKYNFPNEPVPLLYHPKGNQKQTIQVTIPGTDRREELIVVTVEAAEAAIRPTAGALLRPYVPLEPGPYLSGPPKRFGTSKITSRGLSGGIHAPAWGVETCTRRRVPRLGQLFERPSSSSARLSKETRGLKSVRTKPRGSVLT